MDFDDPILPHIPDEDTFNSQLLENNTFEDEIFKGSEEMRQFAEDIRRLQLAKEETPNGFDGDVDGDEGDGEEFDDSIAPENTPLEPDIDNSWSPWPNKISMVRDTVNHFPTKNLVSQLGNHFTVTDPRNAIALQVAHPITSEFITRYPAWQPEEVSEVWHARRWYEFGFEMLNPLWISPETGKQFFVREVTRMKNGELVYPLVWVTLPHGSVGAFSSRVVGQDNDLVIAQEDVITDPIPAKELLAVASEEASHIVRGNFLCRTCTVGGSQAEKKTLRVFRALHRDDNPPRNAQSIKASLEQQLDLAMQGGSLDRVKKLQSQTGTKDFFTNDWISKIIPQTRILRAQKKTKDEIYRIMRDWFDQQPGLKRNPLLDVAGLDPAHDTPFELLHTYSLGIMKYGWRHVVSRMPKDRVDILVAKLDSAAKDCLDTDKGDALYIWRYSHSLNGRHYRFLSQSLPLQLFGILTEDEDKATCQLMLSIASLGAHLWFPVIKNLDKYINDLEILVANVQDLLDETNPDFITKKPKVHYLCHVIRDVLRYGPVIHQATERHERFNSVVRGCTIRGNGHANSHDVAAWFAHAGICAHLVTGGLFVTETGIWGAGHKVLELRQDHGLCTHLGWSVPRKAKKGKVIRLAGQKDGKSYAVEAASGDHCKVGNWVVLIQHVLQSLTCFEGKILYGRIVDIVPSSDDDLGMVTINRCTIGGNRHPIHGMPMLQRNDGVFVTVFSQAVLFRFAAEHDCLKGNCPVRRLRPSRQERQVTSKMAYGVDHVDDEHFVINLLSLHNPHLIREVLPPMLTEPRRTFEDREAHIEQMVRKLQTESNQPSAPPSVPPDIPVAEVKDSSNSL
ncbi:hypothetical protein LQV05_002685 [Cryptococcus neoformans]|nr:hypothetical protein LQV05_002685 [Cryptococcus neoformans]